MTREEIIFAGGMIAALAVVAAFDQETIWREIVASNGGYRYLRDIAARNGNLRWAGFVRYKEHAWHA